MERCKFELNEMDSMMVDIYRDFIPEQIFDAHMHLYLAEAIPLALKDEDCIFLRQRGMVEDYRLDMEQLLPGVKNIRLNMIVMPDPIMNDLENGLREKANNHVLLQYQNHPECVATPYILPCDSEATIYALADRPGVCGLKCYCYGAGSVGWGMASIEEFLPEAAWVVANERHLPIVLHMMRPAALSDPNNFAYIIRMTHYYPNAQLVLAHCARAFASWTCVDAIKKLDDCGNIWFDMAAICETGPIMACIMKNAAKRTLWGSDYPICMHRGRAISLGVGQNWLNGERFKGLERAFIATENLMAFWQAARLLDLDQTQINDLFYENANMLFNLRKDL